MGTTAQRIKIHTLTVKDVVNVDKIDFRCEMILQKDGGIVIAKPSHQLIGANIYAEQQHVTVQEALQLPFQFPEYGYDFFEFYIQKLGIVFLWDNGYWGALNDRQRKVLAMLKRNDIYHGLIGEIGEKRKFLYNKKMEA